MQALFTCRPGLAGVSIATGCGYRSSHVGCAPLAMVGAKKAACRDGPISAARTRSKSNLLDQLVGAAE